MIPKLEADDGVHIHHELVPPKGFRIFNIALAPIGFGNSIGVGRLNILKHIPETVDTTEKLGIYVIEQNGTSRLVHIHETQPMLGKHGSLEDVRLLNTYGKCLACATYVDEHANPRVVSFEIRNLLTRYPHFSPIMIHEQFGFGKNGFFANPTLIGAREDCGHDEFVYRSTIDRHAHPIRVKLPKAPRDRFGRYGVTSNIFIPDESATNNSGHTLLHWYYYDANGVIHYEIIRAHGIKNTDGIIHIDKIDPIPIMNNNVLARKFGIQIPSLDGKDAGYVVGAHSFHGGVRGIYSSMDSRSWIMDISRTRMTSPYPD
jgi:hypothetical protein